MTVLITESYTVSGENQEGSTSGDMMGNVAVTTPYQMEHLLSVTLTGQSLAVTTNGMENVETRQNTVRVLFAQTTGSCIKNGENQEGSKSGGTMGGVVITSPYLMVRLLSVTLMGRTRVVVVLIMDGVVTQQNIVLVETVQIIELYTVNGERQAANKNGDMTGCVAIGDPYLMEHQQSVTQTEKNLAVMIGGQESVQNIVLVTSVWITG